MPPPYMNIIRKRESIRASRGQRCPSGAAPCCAGMPCLACTSRLIWPRLQICRRLILQRHYIQERPRIIKGLKAHFVVQGVLSAFLITDDGICHFVEEDLTPDDDVMMLPPTDAQSSPSFTDNIILGVAIRSYEYEYGTSTRNIPISFVKSLLHAVLYCTVLRALQAANRLSCN